MVPPFWGLAQAFGRLKAAIIYSGELANWRRPAIISVNRRIGMAHILRGAAVCTHAHASFGGTRHSGFRGAELALEQPPHVRSKKCITVSGLRSVLQYHGDVLRQGRISAELIAHKAAQG